MAEFVNKFLIAGQFIPHGHCYLWKPGLLWLHVVSDSLIALAYYSIPLMLVYFVRKRKDVPFDWIFLLFGAFIIACGTTHVMEIWTLWHPNYWLSGFFKVITAIISVSTAMLLVPSIPKALALPSPAQLEAANVILQNEISERKRAEEKLLYNAFHDSLTNLPNRALLMDRVKQSLLYSKRHQDYLFALLFLDIDRFKAINDSLGHAKADQLLIDVACRLKECLRPEDTIARIGGDEFVILLEDIKDINNAIVVADRIQKALMLPFCLKGHEVFITTSIGIALSTTNYAIAEDILRDADIAMYRAKALSLGQTRYEVFDTSMHAQVSTLLHLETELRRAIERKEFRLDYQPIVLLESGTITGFEALVRWQHPDRGLVAPADFIPLAEETGLIVSLGWWVLREACRQMRAWQLRFPGTEPLTISVNTSGKQFAQPDLSEQIKKILQETQLNAHSLKLEITESVLMENAEVATAMLLQLQALDIRISLDDFGTGYSSLSYLHRFPIDTLKIDRSFILDLGADLDKMEIIRTIIGLAENLKMEVVAEGVETRQHVDQLKRCKCKFGQGYFFSKPLNSKTAEALLASQNYNLG
ncbi:MAG: EAL domain-containing protein [Chroococcidiopsidaceae cyanobacterium CP_BM_RX_35]|nr:EAL domain-containing protein [Chroococcidiopsidaceae cyanobacterium CP_BM_RX_35]